MRNILSSRSPTVRLLTETLALVGDETVQQFEGALSEALCEAFDLDGKDWYVRDIASDWCVVIIWFEDGRAFFKVPYTRSGKVFTFGEAQEVEPKVVYEPVADEGSA